MSLNQQVEKSTDKIVYKEDEVKFIYGEFEYIARSYGLGRITEDPEIEKGGFSNYLFKLTTDTGTYMVRARTEDLSPSRRKQRDLEYAVTDYLHDQPFPYEIPRFLPNKEGEKLTIHAGKNYDVYKRLPGTSDYKREVSPDIIEAVARYHKAMANFSLAKPDQVGKTPDWLYNQLLSIEERVKNPQTDLDTIMNESMPFLKDAYVSVNEHAKLNAPNIIIHADLDPANILYDGSKISGIIDFGNVQWGTKERDLVKLTSGDPSELSDLVREYRKHNDLSNEGAANILPEKILKMISGICWIYSGMKKHLEAKNEVLRRKIEGLKKTKVYWDDSRKVA